MELSSPKNKNFLSYSGKKKFLYFRKWNFQTHQKFLMFLEMKLSSPNIKKEFIFSQKKIFSYISGKEPLR